MSELFPQRPKLKQLISRILADIDYRLPGAELRTKSSLLTILGMVTAAATHGVYGYIDRLKPNLLPSTCSDAWLPLWAKIMRVPRLEATKATGRVFFTGEASVDIPVGTEIEHLDSKQLFVVSTQGSTAQAVQVNSKDTGSNSNLIAGTALVIKTPIAGISADITVDYLVGGANKESLSAWRTRIVKAFSERDKIGDKDDYESWVLASHPAITQAWVYPQEQYLGELTIVCLTQNSLSLIPDDSILLKAQQAVEVLRNAGAKTYLIAPSLLAVDIHIGDIIDNDDVKTNIGNALRRLFLSKVSQYAKIRVQELQLAINSAYTGDYTLISPLNKIEAVKHEVLVLGDITWN